MGIERDIAEQVGLHRRDGAGLETGGGPVAEMFAGQGEALGLVVEVMGKAGGGLPFGDEAHDIVGRRALMPVLMQRDRGGAGGGRAPEELAETLAE